MQRSGRLSLLWLAVVSQLTAATGSGCSQVDCKQIWFEGQARKEMGFYMFENSTSDEHMTTMHWQWSTGLSDRWTVYYKEWPRGEGVTGGFLLTSGRGVIGKLSWKVKNRVLQWTTVYRQAFVANWNATVCNRNLSIQLESTNRGTAFYLGEVMIGGGKYGRRKLDDSSILLKSLGPRTWHSRSPREVEEMDGKDKETVWNKIKGWFKELFDESEHDDRGWLTRVGDWMLGFLQRVLT